MGKVALQLRVSCYNSMVRENTRGLFSEYFWERKEKGRKRMGKRWVKKEASKLRRRRAAGFCLAALLTFTSVPLPALAEGEGAPENRLVNIASDCKITAPGTNEPTENMVDGDAGTKWSADSYNWPSTVEFKLPEANTKSVRKVAVKFEHDAAYPDRMVDIELKYAKNSVTSDLAKADEKQGHALMDDYVYEFPVPQGMTHLYVTIANPMAGEETGLFWPAIAEVEIYIDEDVEEEVELINLASTRAKQVVLETSVNTEQNQKSVTDGDEATAAPLHTKKLGELAETDAAPFAEVILDTDQKIRKFVLAMAKDASGAEYEYTIYGKKRGDAEYAQITAGTVGTADGESRAEVTVSEIAEIAAKEVEYNDVKVVFGAKNDAARQTVPQLAELQILANKATVADVDSENIAWGSLDLHTNYNQDTVGRIVDGNKGNTWTAKQYPAYVDIGLDGEYSLSEIQVFTPKEGYSQYSLYYSNDGQNYSKLAEKTGKDSCPADGEKYPANGVKASSVRILMEYHSQNEKAVLNEVRVLGKRVGDAPKKAGLIEPEPFEGSAYDKEVTSADTIAEVQGIIRRNLGGVYVDWFTFELGGEGAYDYYEISEKDGKIHIKGNDGVSLASGLNHYLKYYCKALITQVGNQVKMPSGIVPVNGTVRRECKVPVRYAYNYCTMSYSMPFWGEDEWQKELDWLALNGVNVVLDITAQEEVWRQFLDALGYSHADIKDYIAGPAFYAWAYMANLSGFGGPVHDAWFSERTEFARKNQRKMRNLGMQPVLQGYSGMVPVNIVEKAQGDYALSANDVLPQGNWCEFQRPYMLRTTSDAYKKYAELFYQCQKNVFGDVTDYYATDPFHEGGNTGGLDVSQVSANVVDSMVSIDSDAVWIIQAWQGNPSAALMRGLEGKREHALVLDLYAEKDTHWNDPNYAGGKEFSNTPWVYCMLNNFGGRMGLHGHMDNLVSGVVDAANTASHLSGIGITPEGSQNNPVLYDLLFESVWCDDASAPLQKIDTKSWLRDYAERRYGAKSENAYQAMRILERTVYKASLNMNGQGAPESYVNARPATSIGAASTWGNAVISYDMEDLEEAARLLLSDYDALKGSDGYLYDLADILKQILSNSAQSYHGRMVAALENGDLEEFTDASDWFLALIDEVEEVLGTRTEFLLGSWVEQAKALADGTDDFTKDLYEFNAKALITTWGAYPQCESGGLKDYSNRQWAGLTKDVYKQRWQMWIDYQKAVLRGEHPEQMKWFAFEYEWARANTEYTTKASGKSLKTLGETILANFSVSSPATDSSHDYPTEKLSVKEAGSQSGSDPAENVLNSDNSAIWHTDWNSSEDVESYQNHFLTLTLSEETEIGGLRYLPRQSGVNGIVTEYEIYVSLDGSSYTKAAEGKWAGDHSWKLCAFEEPMKAKYVKFVSKKAVSDTAGQAFTSAAAIRVTYPLETASNQPVTGISLHAEEGKTGLSVGETMQLTPSFTPEGATGASLVWASDREEVLTVNKVGLIRAVGSGTANVTVSVKGAESVSASISLTVGQEPAQTVPVSGIALTAANGKTALYVGETVKLTAAVEPQNATNQEVAYTSSDAKVAAVGADGLVTAVAKGSATITAAANDGSNVTGSIVITVSEKPVENPRPEKGEEKTVGSVKYKVTASTGKTMTVKIVKPTKKNQKKVNIKPTVSVDGYNYKITEIGANAYKGDKKIEQVTIGANVKKIGKSAFANCKNLKKIVIKSSSITSIGKDAFKGIKKRAVIVVPKKKFKKYKEYLKKAKLPGYVKVQKGK